MPKRPGHAPGHGDSDAAPSRGFGIPYTPGSRPSDLRRAPDHGFGSLPI
jgi:hypothetical protein